MTKILYYKLAMGLAFISILFVVIFANTVIHQQKNSANHYSRTEHLIHAYKKPADIKKIKLASRVNTFQYLSYILNDEEEKLKEKLIKRYALSEEKAEKYTKIIAKVSEEHNISGDLLAALIRTESNYYSKAVSHKNAIGPTQIIAKYWKKDCAANLFDIGNNVQCAAIILNRYKNRCRNNWDCALKMYNIGPGNYYKKNKFYQQAGARYLTKINKNLKLLNS